MTCKQLGGPERCQVKFHAETFDEVAKQSHTHGSEMFKAQDEAHLKAGAAMKEMMQEPGAMQKWMDERKKEFDDLADD